MPDDFCAFLEHAGGATGMMNEESYVNLFSSAEILELNEAYAVPEFLPGYLLIGNVNDEALVIEQNSNYFIVPFIGMFEENCVKIAQSFEQLLESI